MTAWLHTDEYEEIKATLKACRTFISLAKKDISCWKWVFIAVHNAVQGCMVVALTRSDGFGAMNPKDEERWREAYDGRAKFPRTKEKLLSFLELYEKIKQPKMLQYSSLERFKPSGTQGSSMKKLNQLRDEFIHFTPKGWSLHLDAAPRVVSDCLEVAATLIANSNRFMLYTTFKEGELLKSIRHLQRRLAKIEIK